MLKQPDCSALAVIFSVFSLSSYLEVKSGLTPELSDRRRQERWSARGASEFPPSRERRSGAAVRSSGLVMPLVFFVHKTRTSISLHHAKELSRSSHRQIQQNVCGGG